MDIPSIDDDYVTLNRPISLFAGLFPSLVFYTRALTQVVQGGLQARAGRYSHARWTRNSYNVFRAMESVGAEIRVENLTAFRTQETPCVIVANHMSSLETFLLPYLLLPHHRISFVLKKSLTEYPLFNHVARFMRPIVVSRTNPREDFRAVMDQGQALLAENISVIVFPQTTRTTHLDPAAFNSIGIKLAKKARVPVLPLALRTDAWGNGKLLKDFGRIDPRRPVRFSFGTPLMVSGNGRDEHKAVIDFIRSKLASWGIRD
ncbi:MAG TPA: lysophospholipid acyltransferase family protein [Desulfomicrobiaceae bacterium]|nr:lysophospholipid acyltransferase family protein [Desulfomicrobiaceae bacterium]